MNLGNALGANALIKGPEEKGPAQRDSLGPAYEGTGTESFGGVWGLKP